MLKLTQRFFTIFTIVIFFIPAVLYLGILGAFSWGKDYFATGDFDKDFTH